MVNLIMQVYRGDQYWRTTIERLAATRNLFNEVVVSFDGSHRSSQAEWLVKTCGSHLDLQTLVTPKIMTASEHSAWLRNQSPVSDWPSEQLVMQLAEDDLIEPDPMQEALSRIATEPDCALFGSWQYADDISSVHGSSYSEGAEWTLTSEKAIAKRLSQLAMQGQMTSVSGIVVPMYALRNYFHLLDIRGRGGHLLHGVRAEFFLVTQPGIKTLIESRQPIMSIQRHANQAGQRMSRAHANNDEALYQMWLIMRAPQGTTGDRALAACRLAKRISLSPLSLLNLPRAGMAFRSINRFRTGSSQTCG